jgi:hypothetical protein
MADANGQPISLGSGFFVMDGIVATNVHVIAGASQGRVKFAGQSQTYNITGTVGIDDVNDLALLKVNGQTAPALALGESDAMSVGDDIYVAGNPEGLEGTLSSGIVSALRQIQDRKLLQITAPISPGSSGGPVLNAHGEVIGVAVATFKGGQNLNFAVPSMCLTAMLTNIRPVSPLSAESRKTSSATGSLGGNLTDAVQITHRMVHCNGPGGRLTFSIRNSLPQPIEDVTFLFVYRDKSGDPVDYAEKRYTARIPPGLAKAIDSYDTPSVPAWMFFQEIGKKRGYQCAAGIGYELPAERFDLSPIEIRILGFRIVDE